MESISIKANDNLIKRITRHYDSQKIESDTFDFEAKTVTCRVTILEDEVCFLGADALKHASLWSKEYQKILDNTGNEYVATASEGELDLFGPIVAVSCYVTDELIEYIQSLHIPTTDLTVAQIVEYTKKLSSKVMHTSTIIDNTNYNKFASGITKNAIRSRIINDAMVKMVKTTGKTTIPYILDDYIPKKTHMNYLADVPSRYSKVDIVEDASNYEGYVAASILAKYTYLSYLSKMQKSLKIKLPRGTQSDATQVAVTIGKKYGFDILSKVIKFNATNMNAIKKKINV